MVIYLLKIIQSATVFKLKYIILLKHKKLPNFFLLKNIIIRLYIYIYISQTWY